jgi:FG-GAP-like repeat
MKKWLILTAAVFLAGCNTTPQPESNATPKDQTVLASGWEMAGTGDFDSDGRNDDVLWRNYKSGENHVWIMDGASYQGSKILAPVTDLNWVIGGVGDMDGDGHKDDIVVRHRGSLENRVLIMENYTIINQATFTDGSPFGYFNNGGPVPAPGSPSFEIAGVSDFNGDGKGDVVWHSQQGETVIWFMNGATFLRATALPRVPDAQWNIVGVSDMNGDGQSDLVWQHWPQPGAGGKVDRPNSIWFMNGSTVTSAQMFQSAGDPHWVIETVGDNNGDGKGDLLWRNDVTGDCVFWYMNATTILSGAYFGNVR